MRASPVCATSGNTTGALYNTRNARASTQMRRRRCPLKNVFVPSRLRTFKTTLHLGEVTNHFSHMRVRSQLASRMVVFNIRTPIPSILLAASMHGVADICRPRHLYPYTLLFAPLPPTVVTTILFLVSSVWHFAQDIGWKGTLGLHTACGLVYSLMDPTMAFGIMSVYYCALHVPMCYIRLFKRRSYLALTIVASLTLITYCASKTSHSPPYMYIHDRLQLLVVCHVLSEASQQCCVQ